MKRTVFLIAFLACALTRGAYGQQGVPVGEPFGQWFTSTGAVCNACKLYFYIAGTTTPLDTYTVADLTIGLEHTNPVILNSAGRPPSPIYLNSRAYKVVLKTSADVTIWTADNVVGIAPPANVLSKTTTYTVTTADGKDALIQADSSGGAFTVTLYTAVGNPGRVVRVTKTDSSTNAVTIDANGAETINGALTYTLVARYDTISLISTGAAWVLFSQGTSAASRLVACECRLTLTSGTPVTTSDVTGAGTLYLTPFRGNRFATYNGTNWDQSTFTEVSLALTLTNNTNYDVFVYRSSGTPTLEVNAWSNDTTRANALTTQDGIYVASWNTTRLYVGTIRASASNQTEDSLTKRFVWNHYNRVPRPMRRLDTTDTWTYNTAAWRQGNNSTSNQLAIVQGLAEDAISVRLNAHADNSNDNGIQVGIGEDSASAPASGSTTGNLVHSSATARGGSMVATYIRVPAVGYHYYTWLEYSAGATGTFYGDGGSNLTLSGMEALWFN